MLLLIFYPLGNQNTTNQSMNVFYWFFFKCYMYQVYSVKYNLQEMDPLTV